MITNYAARIRALDDDALERFVTDWAKRRTRDYVETQRWSGTGDMGRDVVGYVTRQRHEGEWDNFQCKQLSSRLSEKAAFVELGKIFMHSAAGEYRLPRGYTFVAPKGVVRNVQNFVAHPERFRQAFLDRWNELVAPELVENQVVTLTPGIRDAIERFAFDSVYWLDAAGLAEDEYAIPALVKWFGYDPGAAPPGVTPDLPQDEEAPYIEQLIGLYGERRNTTFADYDSALADPEWGQHLREQRTRYFEAAAFDRYYRDSTPPDYLVAFKDDLYHGVVDTHRDRHSDGLARVLRVLAQASQVSPAGVLGRYAKVPVKQGTCHQFANEGRLPWRK
ncbi:ABC-three component system protein [Bradyrhizobium yuanmingense]|uniref:ABC-three component system protein n=1 Tax=Bradyrhizobium yuanmingense TaxID=108015 RepID=UPI0004B0F43F|nr:ABC-three component system protein [Bradyrhizobium yuanmingense]